MDRSGRFPHTKIKLNTLLIGIFKTASGEMIKEHNFRDNEITSPEQRLTEVTHVTDPSPWWLRGMCHIG